MTTFEALHKIGMLKSQLAASDYKVIKIVEYKAVNKKAPYDINEIHAERQALRDEINELEELMPTFEEGGLC
ncbi:MAG: hypothetical protein K6F71_04430 [Ruminococcus sp.]|uniref:hypothetical protein n=1 Tax=Ruminococcus sp. TaxID=41978 RepID=UPI0025DD3016|nr:hypothetical protein [Ruminococcus sp.]MCR5540068.1 hypothetical protein [Ruminococcus sp.]